MDRNAAAAMVRTYGQAPRQLLRQPHPHPATHLQHQELQEVSTIFTISPIAPIPN